MGIRVPYNNEVERHFLRTVSGVVVNTPHILRTAFLWPFEWVLQGVWCQAIAPAISVILPATRLLIRPMVYIATPITYTTAVTFYLTGLEDIGRPVNPNFRIKCFVCGTVILVVHTVLMDMLLRLTQ